MRYLLAALILSVLLTGCGSTDNQTVHTAPGLQATNWTMKPGEEQTPVIWNGKIAIVMFQRPEGGTPYIQVVDYETQAVLAATQTPDFRVGSAIVAGGYLYVFGTTGMTPTGGVCAPGNSISVMRTADLQTWTAPQVIHTALSGAIMCNNSVTVSPNGYVLAYDYARNSSELPGSRARFLTSSDLVHWQDSPGELVGQNNYLSAITIRYADGYYYAAYTQSYHDKSGYYLPTIVSRSADLQSWETGNKYALVSPLDEAADQGTATDADLVEMNGKTVVIYSTGPQSAWTNQVLRARECDCQYWALLSESF